jgi:hypothetical protein
VVGVHEHGATARRQRERHQTPEGGGIRKVEMHEVIVSGDQKPSEDR